MGLFLGALILLIIPAVVYANNVEHKVPEREQNQEISPEERMVTLDPQGGVWEAPVRENESSSTRTAQISSALAGNHMPYDRWAKVLRIVNNPQGRAWTYPTDGSENVTRILTQDESTYAQVLYSNSNVRSPFQIRPTKAGYSFAGWFTASTGGTRVTQLSNAPANDHTLYAQWERGITDLLPNYVTYEQFGAAGDGETNDAEAILEAHAYANTQCREYNNCLTVKGTLGNTYYIGISEIIDIETNTDWRGARFIIDDFVPDESGENMVETDRALFRVRSIHENISLGSPDKSDISIDRSTTDLNNIINYLHDITAEDLQSKSREGELPDPPIDQETLDAGRDAILNKDEIILQITNDQKRQFIRRGNHENTGRYQRDMILIDSDGNLLNDVVWDFPHISNIVLIPVDNEELIIQNGTFIRRTDNSNIDSPAFRRRYMQVLRSNTIIDNVVHMLNEAYHVDSSPSTYNDQANKYMGFIHVNNSAHVTVQNSRFQPHQIDITTSGNAAYGLNFNNTLFTVLDNVSYPCDPDLHESADWCYANFVAHYGRYRDRRWGIMATNGSKDMTIRNSTLNRIDAHEHIHNLTVIDTTVGTRGFTLIGSGLLHIENVNCDTPRHCVVLRNDYGSTWRGEAVLRNITFRPDPDTTGVARIVEWNNTGDWYFGFDTYFPELLLEDITIDDRDQRRSDIALIHLVEPAPVEDRNYHYIFPRNITIRNVSTLGGTGLKVFPNLSPSAVMHEDFFGGSHITDVHIYDTVVLEAGFDAYHFFGSQFNIVIGGNE